MILNQTQAEAVYSAMCALSSAGFSRFGGFVHGKDAQGHSTCTEVSRAWGGGVVVEVIGYNLDRREHYPSLAAFATAYGLQG